MPKPSKNPGRDVLMSLYLDEHLSTTDIGERFGVCRTVVWKWLAKEGVPTRSISEARRYARRPAFTEEQREAMRQRAAYARSHVSPESIRKQAESLRGRTPPNKGVPWSDEVRARHAAIRATPEYREKLAASLRGEKNHAWKGGIVQRRPSGWRWRQVRDAVYARDNWTCRDCGVKCKAKSDPSSYSGRRIQCHHVVPRRFGGKDTADNLVTLCVSCHHKRERRYDGGMVF